MNPALPVHRHLLLSRHVDERTSRRATVRVAHRAERYLAASFVEVPDEARRAAQARSSRRHRRR